MITDGVMCNVHLNHKDDFNAVGVCLKLVRKEEKLQNNKGCSSTYVENCGSVQVRCSKRTEQTPKAIFSPLILKKR